MTMVEEYAMLDIEEVRERLGLSDSTVRRLVRDRRLRAYRVGRRLKFKPEDIDAYIERQVVLPDDDEAIDQAIEAYVRYHTRRGNIYDQPARSLSRVTEDGRVALYNVNGHLATYDLRRNRILFEEPNFEETDEGEAQP